MRYSYGSISILSGDMPHLGLHGKNVYRLEIWLRVVGFMVEVPLYGGRSTMGVCRDGDIVLRPHSEASDRYIPLLNYYEFCGLEYTHNYLGMDPSGRDMFSFIDGHVPVEVGYTSQDQLLEFMAILRRLHDVSSDFIKDPCKVVCHGDPSPCNVVFRDGHPVAVIDWDGCYVGERWQDLAYVVWLWVNIGDPDRDAMTMAGHIADALKAYGADQAQIADFPMKMIERMRQHMSIFDISRPDYERSKNWIEYSIGWVERNRDTIAERIDLECL